MVVDHGNRAYISTLHSICCLVGFQRQNLAKLNEVQIGDIYKLAGEKRRYLGFVSETPIANDIFTILDKLDIMLLEYPIELEGDRPAFSVAIMYSEVSDKKLTFIGLNTADYYDKIIDIR